MIKFVHPKTEVRHLIAEDDLVRQNALLRAGFEPVGEGELAPEFEESEELTEEEVEAEEEHSALIDQLAANEDAGEEVEEVEEDGEE